MSQRIYKRGSDPYTSLPKTQAQRARMRGPVLPMLPERRSILQRVFGRWRHGL